MIGFQSTTKIRHFEGMRALPAQSKMPATMDSQFNYDIAVSFAGEDREFVESIVATLKARNIRVFYDKDEQASLWGRNLYDHLSELYEHQAQYCLMVISQHYPHKAWTNLERQSAQARSFASKTEYILPLRLDDTEVPGILGTLGYIDARHVSSEKIADLVVQKLGATPSEAGTTTSPLAATDIPMPRVKREFTAADRQEHARKVYQYIRDYFSRAIDTLSRSDAEVTAKMTYHGPDKFSAEIHLRGELKNQCKIWVGGMLGNGSDIGFLQGHHIDLESDSSMNQWASIEDDGYSLSVAMTSFFDQATTDHQDDGRGKVAESFWKSFTSCLEW